MVAFAVIMVLAVVLLCGILYVLMREPRGGSKNRVTPGGVRPPIKDMSVPGDDDRVVDHVSAPLFGSQGDSAQNLQACLTKGMDLIFSVEDLPAANRASLLKLEDVGGEVRQKVLSHIGTLKNFEARAKWVTAGVAMTRAAREGSLSRLSN